MIRQYDLVERIKAYDAGADEDLLNRAYVYAMQAHGSQRRANGDPYFSHPVEVAGILTELKLDCASIVTGLLHDTVEDTEATLDHITELFGGEISRLVDGVTKLNRIELQSEQSKQAENMRKLVLAMSDDLRVLLVKLADRLHNMRTLHFINNPDKRRRIARETLDIYAPLAERIGLINLKDELEDIAFAQLNPDARQSILNRLEQLRLESEVAIPLVIGELEQKLYEEGLPAKISGREKRPFSIWQKMQNKNIAFEQLTDIMAFRVCVEDIEAVYRALGIVHANYRMIPGRFKDYLSTPKPNGYRSVHTAVIGPNRLRIEVQLRTHAMNEEAELGVAAHWSYKQGARTDGRQYAWLRQLLEIVENASQPDEFLEHTKLELFQDQVFCFTPKGDLITLPRGATPIDFAYHVHSNVGDTCVGAKINGRIMPLRTQLDNGDQVEIARSKNQKPSPEWERLVVTGKARSHIRRYIRSQQRSEFLNLGRSLLEREFKREGHDFAEKTLEAVLRQFSQPTTADLMAAVGATTVSAREVVHAVHPQREPVSPEEVAAAKARRARRPGAANSVPITGLIPNLAVHYARCCHPIPGDRIVGIVVTGKGVTIHTIDCDTLENFRDEPERWLDVAWSDHGAGVPFTGRLNVAISNSPGTLGTLTTVVGKSGANITNLKFTHRSQDFFELLLDVEVEDLRHLSMVMAALRASPVVHGVSRAHSG